MRLDAAVRAGDAAQTLALLRAGEPVNARGADGLTPLMVASGLGAFHVTQILLTAGADVHAIDPNMGATALHKAAQSGNCDIAELLLRYGAFVDMQSPILGNTPLMDAVLHKQLDMVIHMLAKGARTAIMNHWQQNAYDIARADGLVAIAEHIQAHDEVKARKAVDCKLVTAVKAGDQFAVQQLIAQGHPLNEQMPVLGNQDDNYTPLGMAAREGHAAIARLLLDAGAQTRPLIGLMGGTALHDAAYFGHADVLELIASHAASKGERLWELDVQGAYNGLCALHDAAWHGHLDAVKVLLEAGAQLDLRSHTGATPRNLAQLYGYRELAQLLSQAEGEQSNPAS